MERKKSSQQIQQVAEQEKQDAPVTEEVTAITTTDSSSDIQASDIQKTAPRKKRKRRHLLPKVAIGLLLGAGIVGGGVYGYRWWENAQRFQQTDNAYIATEIIPVTSRVSGIVTQVTVNDNQIVSPGTLLVKLDPRDYQLNLARARAALELTKQQSAIAQGNANLPAINIPEPTLPPSATPQAKQAANQRTNQQTQAINEQRNVNQQQYKASLAAVTQAQAEVKQAELLLSYTNISALELGKVGNRKVQVGQRVLPGQMLMEIVKQRPWVVANFQETQLGKIQPGQKVEIKIPAFPNQKFRGTVDSMAPTSVSGFPAVTDENVASGNTNNNNNNQRNGVQRIPVKVLFDQESLKGFENRITPGMSASVSVETKAK
jgi:membrane fusion protein, multidrug efflux system